MHVHQVFGDILRARVLSIPLPVHHCFDTRIWRSSSLFRVVMSDLDLYNLFDQMPQHSFLIGWIWKIRIHLGMSLFI